MKNIAAFIAILAAVASLGSCSSTSAPEPGPGEKRFVVTPDSAEAWGLKPVSFSVLYPGSMTVELAKTGVENSNYIQVYDMKEGIIRESVSIGYSTIQKGSPTSLALSLLEQLKASFVAQGVKIDESTMLAGEEKIDGKQCYTLKAPAEIDMPDAGLSGNYLLMFAIVEPEKESQNGVLMIFTAHESTGTKSFDDFTAKGMSGRMWETFRYE